MEPGSSWETNSYSLLKKFPNSYETWSQQKYYERMEVSELKQKGVSYVIKSIKWVRCERTRSSACKNADESMLQELLIAREDRNRYWRFWRTRHLNICSSRVFYPEHGNRSSCLTKTATVHTSIREVSDSNLDLHIGYLDWDFSWFLSVPPGKYRDSSSIGLRPLSSK